MPNAPQILGVLNITQDSFSDGGKYLAPEAALAHARQLKQQGAHILDIGAASSHPDAASVPPAEEIARLQTIWRDLRALDIPLSVDSFQPEVQLWALENGADYLNDVNGFANPEIYPALAKSPARLIVMHALQAKGKATRAAPPEDLWQHILDFFAARLQALRESGIEAERCILDPGMGFFLGNRAASSIEILRRIAALRRLFGLDVMVGVSRKSFLRTLTDTSLEDAAAPTLAAELFAAAQGATHIRTHDPKQLSQALPLWQTLLKNEDK